MTRTTTPPHDEQLIDARAVAERLGCAPRTVYRLADAGRIPWGTKVGRLRRWRAIEIDQFIRGESNTTQRGARR